MTSVLCDGCLSPAEHNSLSSTTPPANGVQVCSSGRRPTTATGATEAAGTTELGTQSLLSQLSSVLFDLPHTVTTDNVHIHTLGFQLISLLFWVSTVNSIQGLIVNARTEMQMRFQINHKQPSHHITTVSRPFFRDHSGEPVPEENF